MSGPGRRVVAVDGPAASGKTTLARRLAAHFGLDFLDTGLLYRAVAWKLLRTGRPLTDVAHAAAAARAVTAINLDPVTLRSDAISQGASVVAAIPEVRRALLGVQRRFGQGGPGAVLAGRDIGTVVFPHAELKIFMTASPETRAQRRFDELQQKGQPVSYEAVLENVMARDHIDTHREDSPLRKAADAYEIDNSHLSRQQQFDKVLALVAERAKTL